MEGSCSRRALSVMCISADALKAWTYCFMELCTGKLEEVLGDLPGHVDAGRVLCAGGGVSDRGTRTRGPFGRNSAWP